MYTQPTYLETTVNNIKVTLYLDADGDYRVEAETMDYEPEFLTLEIFDEFEDAEKFYDELIESYQNEG